MIQTIIVDDELLAGVGVQSLIDGKEDVKVCGVFSDPKEAIPFLRKHTIDIVITDIEMADMSGLEFIQIIREQCLADGVVILSCHDDFSYAQEAISKGTDSYMLKHCISQSKLLEEIKKVYRKTHKSRLVNAGLNEPDRNQKAGAKKESYVVSVIRIPSDSAMNVDSSMLVNLLEGVVKRYDMGTVFAPYNREIFIIFQFKRSSAPQEVRQATRENLDILRSNIQQYLSCGILFGVSEAFFDLKLTHQQYDQAVASLEMSFYQPEKQEFFYHKNVTAPAFPVFSREGFLETDGMERFEEELADYLQCAFLHRLSAASLKVRLSHSVGRTVEEILRRHRFSDDLVHRWNRETELVDILNRAGNMCQLRELLTERMRQFYTQCRAELNEDALSEILAYIENHLACKLSLVELAELSCMSVPSFGRKFKERTGMTLVQYLNVRRIERAKLLLRDSSCTLEQIAEKTGFSNANYLIRVFKKVTGQTISEYRK